jgi:hypothetical protein
MVGYEQTQRSRFAFSRRTGEIGKIGRPTRLNDLAGPRRRRWPPVRSDNTFGGDEAKVFNTSATIDHFIR